MLRWDILQVIARRFENISKIICIILKSSDGERNVKEFSFLITHFPKGLAIPFYRVKKTKLYWKKQIQSPHTTHMHTNAFKDKRKNKLLRQASKRTIIRILHHFPLKNIPSVPDVYPNGSVTPLRCPWLCPRENIYYPLRLLVFLASQGNKRSTIRGFHLYSDKGYLGNLVLAISHYGESYEAEIKFCSQWLWRERGWKVYGSAK